MTRGQITRAFRRLARRAGHPDTRLAWGRDADFPRGRDFAYTDGRTVTLAPKITQAGAKQVRALLAHELGHVAALRFGLSSHTERQADQIAEAILGESIGYDRADIQCAGLRRKRPKHLRQ